MGLVLKLGCTDPDKDGTAVTDGTTEGAPVGAVLLEGCKLDCFDGFELSVGAALVVGAEDDVGLLLDVGRVLEDGAALTLGPLDIVGLELSVGLLLVDGALLEVGFELSVGSDDFDGAVDVDGDDVTDGWLLGAVDKLVERNFFHSASIRSFCPAVK